MSTVVRKGIIELEVRATKSRLESPQVDAAARAYKETEKAQREVAKADVEMRKGLAETTKVTQEFGIKSLAAFREGGEGAFRMARGIAFLSASGDQDLRKLIQTVALAQGAFDAFAGASKVVTSLAGILGGPLALAVTGVTAVVTAGGLAWRRYNSDLEESAKAAREARDALREYETDLIRVANRRSGQAQGARAELADLGIRLAIDPAERERRLRAEVQRTERESGRLAAEEERIRRGTLKTRGERFGEGTPALQGLLDEFGGFQGIRERRTQIAREEEAATRRRIEKQEELFRLESERAQAQQSAFQQTVGLGVAGAGVFGGPAANLGVAQFAGVANAGLQQQMQQFNQEFQKLFDDLFKTLEKVEARRREFEDDVNSGNTK